MAVRQSLKKVVVVPKSQERQAAETQTRSKGGRPLRDRMNVNMLSKLTAEICKTAVTAAVGFGRRTLQIVGESVGQIGEAGALMQVASVENRLIHLARQWRVDVDAKWLRDAKDGSQTLSKRNFVAALWYEQHGSTGEMDPNTPDIRSAVDMLTRAGKAWAAEHNYQWYVGTRGPSGSVPDVRPGVTIRYKAGNAIAAMPLVSGDIFTSPLNDAQKLDASTCFDVLFGVLGAAGVRAFVAYCNEKYSFKIAA